MRRVQKERRADPITEELVIFLGGKCALCGKSYPDNKSWVIHHRSYKKGEKDSKDFKEKIHHIITRGKRKGKSTTKTIYFKQQYYEYLRPIVLADPARFAPLHHYCHQAVSRLARWKKDNLERLYTLAMEQK